MVPDGFLRRTMRVVAATLEDPPEGGAGDSAVIKYVGLDWPCPNCWMEAMFLGRFREANQA